MVALLVFLMCACVGSVILAAANTAAGRASSIKENGNAERYAVNSALKLIKSDMNAQQTMAVRQTWTANYSQSDYDASGDVGQPVLADGSVWVLSQTDDGWNGNIIETAGDSAALFDAQELIDNTVTNKAELYQIRDMMAYQVYRHCWENISNPDSVTDGDPWSSVAMGDEEWTSVLSSENQDYQIQTAEPYQISLKDDETMPAVYAEFTMDSSFQFTVELYAKDESGNKLQKRYLIYTPETGIINRSSTETQTGEPSESELTLPDGTAVENYTYTYQVNRSLTLFIDWDEGTISTSGGTNG